MTVVLLGAGGPAGVNFARALHEAGQEVIGLEGNEYHLPWAARWCEEVVLHGDDLEERLAETLERYPDSLVHAQPDSLVLWLADHAPGLGARTYLPERQVIVTCQDKWEAGLQWRRTRKRLDRIEIVQDAVGVELAVEELGLPLWIRARYGAGARGSALVKSLAEGRHWVEYWLTRDPLLDFVAEGYLPGRDLAWESLWFQGELIASYLRERIEYIYPYLAPSGKTGTPVVARIIHDPDPNVAAYEAVRAIDSHPHGVYSVDLVEDAEGVARPTEINAGRFFTTSYLSAAAGVNIPALYVWMALHEGERPVLPLSFNSVPEGIYARHIDCDAVWTPTEPGQRGVQPPRLDERRLTQV